MKTKALLLAGGLGTRLRPLTETVPKCLVPVAGKPMLTYWLEALEACGVNEALVNTHHLPDAVRAYIETENARRPVQLIEAWEPELLGSAGTVAANRTFADDADTILVIYADNLSTIDLGALLAFHARHNDPMTMALFHTEHPTQCGIATTDPAGRITAFVEKPKEPESDLANAGLYVLDRAAWHEIADMGVFDFGFDVLPKFIGRMHGFSFDGYHKDIGTPAALEQANKDAGDLFK